MTRGGAGLTSPPSLATENQKGADNRLSNTNKEKHVVYTKDDLLSKVRDDESKAEAHYVETGPRKREQEAHYGTGVSVVGMNVELLVDWLDNQEQGLCSAYENLSKADRREVWEASGFHFGISGYEEHDADFWWTHEA